jgi:hypothetical protein
MPGGAWQAQVAIGDLAFCARVLANAATGRHSSQRPTLILDSAEIASELRRRLERRTKASYVAAKCDSSHQPFSGEKS